MSSYTFPGQLAAFHVMTHHRQPSWPRLGLDIKSFVVVVVFNSCKMWHHPSPMVGTWRVSRHSPPETAAMNTDTHISSWTGRFVYANVQVPSRVQLFVTPWTATHQASLSFTLSQSLLKLISIESVMPSSHLVLYCPLLLLPSILPTIRIFLSL